MLIIAAITRYALLELASREMFHELRENCLANIHPSLSAMGCQRTPTDVGGCFLTKKSSNGKILKTGLTHYIPNTYATSEYQAKAKLAIAVSWLRQGDARAPAQAEAEYKDFILFYPNMKEAAELQVGEPLRTIREQKATTPH